MHRRCILMARFVFLFVAHSPLRSAARKPHRRCGCAPFGCTFNARRVRTCVRNFDTITCTCRCERAVIFACTLRVRGVTEAKRGRYASGACVCVHTAGVREFHAPRGCICDRAARACACACECTLRVRDLFFEAHSPLRSAARETTRRVGSASLPK